MTDLKMPTNSLTFCLVGGCKSVYLPLNLSRPTTGVWQKEHCVASKSGPLERAMKFPFSAPKTFTFGAPKTLGKKSDHLEAAQTGHWQVLQTTAPAGHSLCVIPALLTFMCEDTLRWLQFLMAEEHLPSKSSRLRPQILGNRDKFLPRLVCIRNPHNLWAKQNSYFMPLSLGHFYYVQRFIRKQK